MLKAILKSLFPRSMPADPAKESSAPKDHFARVYEDNLWEGKASRSGPGSEGDFAEQKIAIFREIISEYGVSSILDLGCGDFYWMKEVAQLVSRYHGVDVVQSVISANKRQFENEHITFQCLDLSDRDQQKSLSVTRADLVVSLDVFGHLLNHEVHSLLDFILHGTEAKLFLITNRREPGSTDYLRREKTRNEGIDIEHHPLFLKRRPRRLKQIPGLYPNDFFDLYDLTSGNSRRERAPV